MNDEIRTQLEGIAKEESYGIRFVGGLTPYGEKDDPYDLPHVPKHSPSSLLTLSILLKSGSDGIQNLFSLLPRLPSSNINRTVHKGFPGSFFHDWFSFQSLPSPAVVQQPIPQCFAPRNHLTS